MALPKILVTGSNGQVGKELQEWNKRNPGKASFVFVSRADMPIHHFELVRNFFDTVKPDYCLNCAAYTAVDRAESEPDVANLVNGESVGVLAEICRAHGTRLIHLSTDYVFNGKGSKPYGEDDETDPVNVYGASKRMGENLAREKNPETIIIRTSWVYSEFGNNFVKTMVRLMGEKEVLNVVNDQVGSPTYAYDLAQAMMEIVLSGKWVPGVYHYSNQGVITWYEFALTISEMIHSRCKVMPIPTEKFPTPAARPGYSVLQKDKIGKQFLIYPGDWKDSLRICLMRLDLLA
jgi:dTDP-4-dehydrorhamnose reductase